ncbi:MAG: amino acid ABC transporter ATP-binding protein [Treponema sp.]|nr:amino acid ABC transporter ATP-binding protein [Treponema sp.]
MESEIVVSVQGLKKNFGKGDILKDISFDLQKGKTLSIIGPSGSGKSTILRCLCQLESVSGGTISVDGDFLVKDGVYASKSDLRKIGLKIGMVFQNFNLFPHYSVLENVAEPQIRVKKTPRALAEKNALEWLARMNLADKAQKYPQKMSGGQQQRVAIARALALNPQVLVFDEPTSALDPELTGEILSVIKDLAAQKMTMIVVTHEMSFARDTSDEIIFIDGGVVVERGDPQQVINSPKEERTKLFLKRFSEK